MWGDNPFTSVTPSNCSQKPNPPSAQKACLTRTLPGQLCHQPLNCSRYIPALLPLNSYFMILPDTTVTEPSPQNDTHRKHAGYHKMICQKLSTQMNCIFLRPEVTQLKVAQESIIKTQTLESEANQF